jgi:uncharacterized protein YceK
MKRIVLLSLAATTLLMSSCATVFTGSKQPVNIASYPAGAKIQVDGIDRGVTPSVVKLKKGFEGQTVTLKKEGYEAKTFQPETSFNAVSVLNLFSILGWGIDAATGAMMRYNPKAYELQLEQTAEAKAEAKAKAEAEAKAKAEASNK